MKERAREANSTDEFPLDEFATDTASTISCLMVINKLNKGTHNEKMRHNLIKNENKINKKSLFIYITEEIKLDCTKGMAATIKIHKATTIVNNLSDGIRTFRIYTMLLFKNKDFIFNKMVWQE